MGFGFIKSSRTKALAIVLVICNILNMNWVQHHHHPDFCHWKESIFSMFWERERENRWMSSLHSGDIWTQKLQLEDIDDDWLIEVMHNKDDDGDDDETRTCVPTQAPFWRIGIVANVIVLISISQLYEMISSMQCLSFVLFVLDNYTCFSHKIWTLSIINPATEVVFDRRPF